VSVCVQALLSLHAVPFAFGVAAEHMPVPGLQVPGSLHWSPFVQTTGLLPTHEPAWHVSVCVQALLSLHAVPFGFGVAAEHIPVPGLQVPGSLHWSPFVQTTGVPDAHVPLWHTSPAVHAFPSLHDVPSAATG
jgi:hypothetical protein